MHGICAYPEHTPYTEVFYGVEGLRIADASILPRVTTGNTMAPCVVIGEQAAALLQQARTL
jgi:choline dehydrogenase